MKLEGEVSFEGVDAVEFGGEVFAEVGHDAGFELAGAFAADAELIA